MYRDQDQNLLEALIFRKLAEETHSEQQGMRGGDRVET